MGFKYYVIGDWVWEHNVYKVQEQQNQAPEQILWYKSPNIKGMFVLTSDLSHVLNTFFLSR